MSSDRIVIDVNRCKGCGLCLAACPRQLLHVGCIPNRQGQLPIEISAEGQATCTSCCLCARTCPDLAITVYRPPSADRQESPE